MTPTSQPVQNSRRKNCLVFAAIIGLTGCAAPPPSNFSLNAAANAPAICAAPAPVCPACPACAPAEIVLDKFPAEITPPAETARGRLEKTQWDALPGFTSDNPIEALAAFRQSCIVLVSRAEWQRTCNLATSVPVNAKPEGVIAFFRNNFEPHRVVNADETETGTVTGYYEPLLHGSRVRTDKFRYPVYAAPQDLITIDLSDVYPDLKFRRLRGRLVGNKLVPYLDRGGISGDAAPLKGLEIAYVDNAVELFFLEIQGSGQIRLPDGSRLRVGYADQNGHPFRSLAGLLIRRGEIRAEHASMQGIKEWARRNPKKVRQFLNANPSFVFFRELPGDLSGPIGTLGVPLTAERSIAVDQRVIPLGVPVYLSTTHPGSKQELNRLMVAQDTGGAINGAVRADFYWGFGDDAGAIAGRMKQRARMWVLLPNGYVPANETRVSGAPLIPGTDQKSPSKKESQ